MVSILFPQILLCDIDFSDVSFDTLIIKEDCGLYPPRFKVIISCSPTAKPAIARVEFRGAVNDLIFDIPLHVYSLCKCMLTCSYSIQVPYLLSLVGS